LSTTWPILSGHIMFVPLRRSSLALADSIAQQPWSQTKADVTV
jgi:hypothetical protein